DPVQPGGFGGGRPLFCFLGDEVGGDHAGSAGLGQLRGKTFHTVAFDRVPVAHDHGHGSGGGGGLHDAEQVLGVGARGQCLTGGVLDRSEEHTSELQSRFDLV